MELKQLTQYIIKKALKEGADQVDVVAVKSTTNEVDVRLGEIEKLGSASPKGLGIRVIKNHKNAITSTRFLKHLCQLQYFYGLVILHHRTI